MLTDANIHSNLIHFYRLDFDDVILAQPIYGDTIGKCGGTGDSLTIKSPAAGVIGFESLCGTLTGQHGNIQPWQKRYIPL